MGKIIKKPKTRWKTRDNRFVCFLDILGFKDKVARLTHDEIYTELSKISKVKASIQEIISTLDHNDMYYDCDIHIVNFSDSIVIFSKNDTFENFEYFIGAVRYLFANSIKDCIPLKGGIAHGEVSLNKEEQIYFGQAIIDSYLLEEDVNYFGIVAHNSIDKFLSLNKDSYEKSPKISKLLLKAKTPLKSGKIFHTNIDWFLMATKKDDIDRPTKILEILKNFYLNVSGSPRKYVDNTIDFFEEQNKTKNINYKRIG